MTRKQEILDAVDVILEKNTGSRPSLFNEAGVVDAMQAAYERDYEYGVSEKDSKAIFVAALRAISVCGRSTRTGG